MLQRPILAVLVAVSVAALGCSSAKDASTVGDSATPTSAPPRPYKPVWTEGPCVVEVPDGAAVTCGTLTVPENRAKPTGAKVTLPVVRIHSTSPTPEPDPVVYLHGGPGIATLPNGIGGKIRNPVLEHRDLIVFDQRGAGLATPSLNCPEREEAFLQALASPAPFSQELASFDTAISTCYQRLKAEGHDLDQYNSATDAADLADLRVAMGFDEWNLWGVSYGTRLALTEMRSYPEGIRSVVLDSVYPPSAGAVDDTVRSGTRAFDALANGCSTDPSCHARFPDVKGDLDKLALALDAAPYTFDFTMPDGTVRTLKLTGNDAVAGLFNALYETSLIPQLPAAIHDLAAGGRALVPLIAQDGIPFVNDTSEGAFLSYECADNGARIDPAVVTKLRKDPGRAGLLLLAGWNVFCDKWPVRHLAKDYGDVVTSDIPTLVIAGEYDPITPPATSKAVADALSDSVFVQVPHAGHGPGPDTECSLGIFTRFFDESTKVDTSCVATIVPAPFA
ncbi:MAG: alpha/beta fold hydrolase [Acidimicrobiales bacterium]